MKHSCRIFYTIIFVFSTYIIFAIDPNLTNTTPEIRWQQQVDYEISVMLDDKNHLLDGSETITYHNNSPDTLGVIWLHLYPNAYKNKTTAYAQQERDWDEYDFEYSSKEQKGWIEIENLQIAGQFIQSEVLVDAIDQMKIILPQPLNPGESLKILLDFRVKIPEIFSRFGHNENHYECTQWFPKCAVYDDLGWHNFSYLDQGEFYSDFGNYDVKITIPNNYRVGATGILQNEEEIAWLDSLAKEGSHFYSKPADERKSLAKKTRKQIMHETGDLTKTLHYKAKQVHDFAWFADPNFIIRKYNFYPEEIGFKPVDIWVMNLVKNQQVWRDAPLFGHDALKFYSKWYGTYPYKQMTVVDGDLSAGGGMEYPNITVISTSPSEDMLENVIMHEIGHQWFYGILANNERDEAWLDEGLNSFSEHRYWNEKYGENSPLRLIPDEIDLPFDVPILSNVTHKYMQDMSYFDQALRNLDQPITLTSAKFNWANYGGMVYSKTAIITTILQQYLGDEIFDSAMRKFYSIWKFRHPRFKDFQMIIEAEANETLDWFFDDLLQTTNKIDLAISDFTVETTSEGFLTTVGLENHGDIYMPAKVSVFSGNQELASLWAFPDETIQFQTIERPKKVILDPQNLLPDMNKLNNYYGAPPIKFKFLADLPRKELFQIFHVPTLSYGKFEKWRLGWKFYRASVFMLPHNFLVSANYSLGSDKINYDLRYSNTKFLKNIHRFDYGISTAQKYGGVLKHNGFLQMEFNNKYDNSLSYSLKIATGMIDLENAKYLDWFDPAKWDLENYMFFETKENFYTKHSSITMNAGLNFRAGFGQDIDNFSRWNFHFKMERYLWGEIYGKIQLNFSTLANSDTAPKQEQIFLGGGIDPLFSTTIIGYDRSADNSDYFLITEDGPSMLGYAKDNNKIGTFGFSWRNFVTLPFRDNFTFKLFHEFGNVVDSEDKLFQNIKMDTGVSVHLSFIDIFFPFWISHPVEVNRNFDVRWRIQITLPEGLKNFGF